MQERQLRDFEAASAHQAQEVATLEQQLISQRENLMRELKKREIDSISAQAAAAMRGRRAGLLQNVPTMADLDLDILIRNADPEDDEAKTTLQAVKALMEQMQADKIEQQESSKQLQSDLEADLKQSRLTMERAVKQAEQFKKQLASSEAAVVGLKEALKLSEEEMERIRNAAPETTRGEQQQQEVNSKLREKVARLMRRNTDLQHMMNELRSTSAKAATQAVEKLSEKGGQLMALKTALREVQSKARKSHGLHDSAAKELQEAESHLEIALAHESSPGRHVAEHAMRRSRVVEEHNAQLKTKIDILHRQMEKLRYELQVEKAVAVDEAEMEQNLTAEEQKLQARNQALHARAQAKAAAKLDAGHHDQSLTESAAERMMEHAAEYAAAAAKPEGAGDAAGATPDRVRTPAADLPREEERPAKTPQAPADE